MKHLKSKKVVLHSDCAQTYKLKVPGLLHDRAVHKSQVVINKGIHVWEKPKYGEIHTHVLPDKGNLYVKTGTQIIDRFWQHLRVQHGPHEAQDRKCNT